MGLNEQKGMDLETYREREAIACHSSPSSAHTDLQRE